MTCFETAQRFFLMDNATIPVRHKDKRPALDAWQPYQTQLPTPDDLTRWFAPGYNNVGVVTGWHGLTVLDFDNQSTYKRWRRWAYANGTKTRMIAQAAYQVSTSRGVHVYVHLREAERNRHMTGIDIKGVGGYVLGEGSTHPTGAQYERVSPGMVIPSINALSDVLPTSILVAEPDLPPSIVQPPQITLRKLARLSDDPWEVIMNPGVSGQGVIDKIRARLLLTDFFPQTKETSHDGRWQMTTCPFHSDENASFWLDTERGIGSCFSGCLKKPVDSIDMYAKLYGLTIQEAIRILAKLI